MQVRCCPQNPFLSIFQFLRGASMNGEGTPQQKIRSWSSYHCNKGFEVKKTKPCILR
jgi:hypothetical protein